jgi:hypothetical protein
MANTLNVTSADRGKKLPLRGDMTGATLDFTPGDNKFPIRFFTEDAKSYAITSSTHQFRVFGVVQSAFSFGGTAGLDVEFMYEPEAGLWVLTETNIVSGAASSGGTGGTGAAATIAVDSTVTGAPGTQASVENVGTASAVRLKFTIPAGQNGTNGTSGTGSTLPAGGSVGQYLGKTSNADGSVGWLTIPASTGGAGGVSFTPEVLLTQDANGNITPDKALGNAFRVLLTKNGKVLNPVGYQPGEKIYIAMRQGPLGPFTMEWDLNWAHPDRQVPILSNQPGGLNEVSARLTDAINASNPGGWITDVGPKASTIGYGVPSFVARNVQTGVEYYVLRSPTQPSGATAMQPGQTLKILRNALGIEAYGAIDSTVNGAGNFLIAGALPNGNRAELRTGPGVRAAYDRGVLAFGGTIAFTTTVQDLILSGAREQSGQSHIAQGVSVTGAANVTLKNVKLYDNENGILSANDYTGRLDLVDCEFDGNAVGDYGYTHNIYMGHHNQPWYATRCTFKNAVGGHNIKSRAGDMVLKQVHCYNSISAREMEMPNGGKVDAQDCIFEHLENAQQNDCVRIGAEGIDTARPRSYVFRNCKFINGKGFANAGSWVWNDDPDVDVYLIDCTFEGAGNWPNTVNGNRGRVIVQFTPGVPPGPRVPVGYQPMAVTQIAG